MDEHTSFKIFPGKYNTTFPYKQICPISQTNEKYVAVKRRQSHDRVIVTTSYAVLEFFSLN